MIDQFVVPISRRSLKYPTLRYSMQKSRKIHESRFLDRPPLVPPNFFPFASENHQCRVKRHISTYVKVRKDLRKTERKGWVAQRVNADSSRSIPSTRSEAESSLRSVRIPPRIFPLMKSVMRRRFHVNCVKSCMVRKNWPRSKVCFSFFAAPVRFGALCVLRMVVSELILILCSQAQGQKAQQRAAGIRSQEGAFDCRGCETKICNNDSWFVFSHILKEQLTLVIYIYTLSGLLMRDDDFFKLEFCLSEAL
jgi:hypothetical protein